jgi:hypothetical protein
MNTNGKNKHYLMLCELHNPALHGKDENSDPFIETHYLVYDKFDFKTGISLASDSDDSDDSDDDNESDDSKINDVLEFLKEQYTNYNHDDAEKHPTIRNYHNIISSPNYIKPEIGEYIILHTQEAIAILKTVWLRIIQRKWKNVFAERQNIIKKRRLNASISSREIYGKWTQTCSNLPGLKGMLNNLKW